MTTNIQIRLQELATEHGIDFKPVDRAIRFCQYATEAFGVREFSANYDFLDDMGTLDIAFVLDGIGLTVTFWDPSGDALCTFHGLDLTEEEFSKLQSRRAPAASVIAILAYLNGYECKVGAARRGLSREQLRELNFLATIT